MLPTSQSQWSSQSLRKKNVFIFDNIYKYIFGQILSILIPFVVSEKSRGALYIGTHNLKGDSSGDGEFFKFPSNIR